MLGTSEVSRMNTSAMKYAMFIDKYTISFMVFHGIRYPGANLISNLADSASTMGRRNIGRYLET
jgi:hypothetical protein